ncbi:hypothetical protein EniLVp02_0263 [Vibrio phage EniLVp02]
MDIALIVRNDEIVIPNKMKEPGAAHLLTINGNQLGFQLQAFNYGMDKLKELSQDWDSVKGNIDKFFNDNPTNLTVSTGGGEVWVIVYRESVDTPFEDYRAILIQQVFQYEEEFELGVNGERVDQSTAHSYLTAYRLAISLDDGNTIVWTEDGLELAKNVEGDFKLLTLD